jgi:integrase
VWQVRLTHEGRTHTATVQGQRRDATKALARLRVDVERSRHRPRDVAGYTVRDLVVAWWNSPTVAAAGTNKSPTTLRTHDAMIRNWIGPHLGDIRVARLGARDIERMVAAQQGKGLQPTSVRRCLSTLRLMLNQAVRWEWIESSPLERVTIDRLPTRKVDPPPTADVVAVLAASHQLAEPYGTILPAALLTLIVTGLRRGELCALRWGSISWQPPALTVAWNVTQTRTTGLVVGPPKSKRPRTIQLEDADLDGLRVLRDVRRPAHDGLFVFGPDDGERPLSPAALSAAYDNARAAAGVRLRLHDIRHWHATHLLAAGEPVPTVQERLGHAHASTTLNIYAHPVQESSRAAARTASALAADVTKRAAARRVLPPGPGPSC